MFSTKRWVNWVLTVGMVFALGCDGGLGGCGCGEEQLPSWDYIPVDQQVEGGGQVRVTSNGFDKLTSLVPAVLNDALTGQCLGKDDTGYTLGTGATWCDVNQQSTDGTWTCNNGCAINIDIEDLQMSVPQNDVFNIRAQVSAGISIPIDFSIIGIGGSCTLNAGVSSAVFDVDVNFGINPTNGELALNLGSLNQIQLNANLSGCGGIGEIVDSVLGIIDSFLNSFIFDLISPLLTPLLDDLIQGFLPDPLGLNHKIDMGALVGGISPGTNASVEFRGVPGGYVKLQGGGMSLGLITGFNADEDETTRTPNLDSEPALCVPPLPAIDFAAAPHNLPVHPTRGTHSLAVAGEFNGAPEPAAEIAIGMSETTLDLVGHHAVTSGTMCMGIGTSLVEQLNLGLIGILVPSLAELGNEQGDNPLLLVLRPQKALDFTIGEGTETDPSLNIAIHNLELDFYAFIYDRYVRGFTIEISMDVGVNLEFTTDANGDPAIMPILTGLETDMIDLVVHNSEFLREDPATLENVLPAIFDLALPLITDGLGAFTVPDFAGFTLTNLSVTKVTTSEDDFLALFANLGQVSSPMIRGLGEVYPSLGDKLREWDDQKVVPMPVITRAELSEVFAPPPAEINAWLAGHPGGDLPTVTLAVPTHDELGRELEYTWSHKRGIRRAFQRPVDGELVLRDRSFAIQGPQHITVQARVVGDYSTHDTEGVEVSFIVDSIPPRILTDEVRAEGDLLVVPATDLVTPDSQLVYAYGQVGDLEPRTDWTSGISLTEAAAIADASKHLRVWVADAKGNQSSADIDVGPMINFHGAAGESGCSCDSASAGGTAGTWLLAGFTLLLLGVGRRRRFPALISRASARKLLGVLPYAALIGALSVIPACSCGGDPGGDLSCEIDEDCAALCPENTIPICFEGQCVCADDVPYGRIGQDSDMDLSSSGASWVSAYNSTHGDLMVVRFGEVGPIPNSEWEYVDGVPDGPVVLDTSDIRGGIFDAGPNVGKYTSVAVQPDDSVVVSYYDVDTGSLKLARNSGGTWAIHTVEAGSVGGDPELGYSEIGYFTSISVRSDDGRPGIAYLAVIGNGDGTVTSELRYAAASSASPSSSSDWNVWVVDTATVPAPDDTNPNILGIPLGTGLFVDSARKSDETPVLVYYDRENGDLKMAEFDAIAGTFAAPVILDSGARDSNNTDVGWYPSITIDDTDVVHVTYVSATSDDLYYINTGDSLPEIVDDGYRIVGQTSDGLPKPEFHFVGDDSSVVLTSAGPVIAYQDATSHELLIANRNGQGEWEHDTVAGNEDPFTGGYGFFASAKPDGEEVVMSTWVISQPDNAVWVEIFRRLIVVE